MVVRKLSVFLLVIAFHVVVLGVVYLATRSDDPVKPEKNPAKKEVVKDTKKNSETIKKDAPAKTPDVKKPQIKTPKYDYVFHTVVKGDFLGKIASQYKVSIKDIMVANNLKDQNLLQLGQKLKIPVNK